jgi:hypothetical protein
MWRTPSKRKRAAVADPLAIYSKLQRAEQSVSDAQAVCEQLRAELDQALSSQGWHRMRGVFTPHATPRYLRTGGGLSARLIVRRERPHPGAQLSFTDHDGYRFQAILTDQTDADIAVIECRHRQHAHVEDRIRDDKDTGLAKSY